MNLRPPRTLRSIAAYVALGLALALEGVAWLGPLSREISPRHAEHFFSPTIARLSALSDAATWLVASLFFLVAAPLVLRSECPHRPTAKLFKWGCWVAAITWLVLVGGHLPDIAIAFSAKVMGK